VKTQQKKGVADIAKQLGYTDDKIHIAKDGDRIIV